MKRPILLLGSELQALPELLRSVFEHPGVGTYQVGFGPPLVQSSPALTQAASQSASALDKLDVYLRYCVLDPEEAARLSRIHRQQLVRRHGPVEAEALDRAAADAIDLSLRLKLAEQDLGEAPNVEAQIILRLDDPVGARWRHDPSAGIGSEVGLVVEMRVDAEGFSRWARWARDWAEDTGRAIVADVELIPHAIVHWAPEPPA